MKEEEKFDKGAFEKLSKEEQKVLGSFNDECKAEYLKANTEERKKLLTGYKDSLKKIQKFDNLGKDSKDWIEFMDVIDRAKYESLAKDKEKQEDFLLNFITEEMEEYKRDKLASHYQAVVMSCHYIKDKNGHEKMSDIRVETEPMSFSEACLLCDSENSPLLVEGRSYWVNSLKHADTETNEEQVKQLEQYADDDPWKSELKCKCIMSSVDGGNTWCIKKVLHLYLPNQGKSDVGTRGKFLDIDLEGFVLMAKRPWQDKKTIRSNELIQFIENKYKDIDIIGDVVRKAHALSNRFEHEKEWGKIEDKLKRGKEVKNE